MENLPEAVDKLSDNLNNDEAAVEQNTDVSYELTEKRPLEESAEDNGNESKKLKTDDENNEEETKTVMSKRQRKMALKQQKWLELKEKRRETNKQKKLQKKQWLAENREAGIVPPVKVKRNKMADSKCKQRIVLDMAYDNLMTVKDLLKCSCQILRCYGLNRRMQDPMQFYICNYTGMIKEFMDRHNGSKFWDIKYTEDSVDKVFNKEEIVYLTSDSPNVLDSLDESKVYIIGGLVDHNAHKGASLKTAENLGVAHAQLPIKKYINMQTRKILTVNQVFEIMTKVVSGESWKEAFISTIPKRKMFSIVGEEDCLTSKSEENICPGTKENNSPGTEEINNPGTKENNSPGTEEINNPGTKENNSPGTEENNSPSTEENNNPGTEEGNNLPEPNPQSIV